MTSLDAGLLDPGTGDSAAFVGDAAYLNAMVEFELALLGALSEAGAAPTPNSELDPAALVDRLDLAAIAAASAAGGNPVIPLVAALRRELPDDLGEVMHFGATSQDVLDSATMLVASRARQEIARRLEPVLSDLAALADRHRHTPVAGRTLGQQAAPTTFGLRIAVLLDGVQRASARLAALELPAQLGGSVGTLAVLVDALGEDRAQAVRSGVAERLGLAARPGVWHVERTTVAELGAALAILLAVLGRLGLETVQGARTELGELALDLPDGAGGSSAMPQKRNPVPGVLLVAAARRAPGLAAALLAAPLVVDDRPAGEWHAEWQPLRELLRLALESAALAQEVASILFVDRGRMRANMHDSHGAIHAERVQWALVPVLGRARAAAVVRDALAEPKFVPAVIAALGREPDDHAALVRRVGSVTTADGPVGLSDRLIDTIAGAPR